MKKNAKIFLILSLIILISISFIVFIEIKPLKEETQEAKLNEEENNPEIVFQEDSDDKEENHSISNEIIQEKIQHEDLINISECSEEFMEEYFKEIEEIEDKDNVLIVSSKEQVKNTYGAAKIVEAPNNQYFLEYNSEEEKNNAIKEFENSDQALYVQENHLYELFESDYNSWGIEKNGLDDAIQIAEENDSLKDVTVAIIDTGCKMELFNDNYSNKIAETYNVYDSEDMYDGHGHGTHIAGTIAEGTSSNVKILPIKVSNSRSFYTMRIIAAVNYITYYKKADVINMSFGSTTFDNALYVAIEAALEKGIISVAAAGNAGTSQSEYPASYDNTISVSAVDEDMKLASFSNYGSKITFAAPGVGIKSINGVMNGTSMATPHVVSAVAMLKTTNKSLSLEQIITLLKNNAIDLGTPGWDSYFGYGLIDMSDFDDLIGEAQNTNIVDFEIRDTKFEAEYGNITNLMSLKMILKDVNGNEYSRYLSELDNLEIENYDAFIAGEQQVKIKYNNMEKTITINNGKNGGDDGGYKVVTRIDGSHAIAGVSGANVPKKLYMPETIKGYKIETIAEAAFKNSDIDTIILPSTVNSIENEAFCDSTIRTVTGGAKEISVGDNAFYNAYKLEKFSAEISSVGIGAFYGCSNLENIKFSNNLVQIKDNAFMFANIKDLNIPKGVTSISISAFFGMPGLETIKIETGNPTYDSRENCNALIQTNTNTIMLGSANTVIPDSVTTIGQYAFFNNTKLKTIHTNKVKTISAHAFEWCLNLESMYLGEGIEDIHPEAFEYLDKTKVYTYTKEAANKMLNDFQGKIDSAICIVPLNEDKVNVVTSEKYRHLDKIDDIEINIQYHGFAKTGELNETITEGYKITYPNGGDCLKKGDTYFKVSATTKHGINIEKTVNVVVDKAIPQYTMPTDIVAKIGTRLSEISLPTGFSWMNPQQTITQFGEQVYYAKFTPTDISNYEIVENIEIVINVKKDIPEFTIPTDIEAVFGQMLLQIELPAGFEWMDENQIIKNTGKVIYMAKYIPEDITNYEIVENIEIVINVKKDIPKYTIPTNIEAIPGQTLSQIELTKGFEWMDENQIIEGLGEIKYKARYIPEDTTNYEIIEDIEITINVIEKIGDKYIGNINSELITFNVAQNNEGATYVSGQIVVVEWVNETSTVPKVVPKMRFKSADGTVNMEVFVTPTGTNTYYFDRFIEGINTSKEYFFEIESGDENNVSPNRKMNVYFTHTQYNNTIVGNYHEKQIRLLKQKIIFEDRTDTYVGNINSELITFNVGQNNEGATYVSGQVVVVEWVDGNSTVPKVAPKMRFKSTDETVNMEVFVTATGTNTYYFDRFIEGINTNKEYFFEIESGDENNVSEYRSMNVYFTQTKYNDTIVGQYKGKNIRLLKQKILFEDDTYIGNINSELKTFKVAKNHEGATYVSGEIVVVEWVDEKSTVPKVTPKMRFKSTDGTVNMEVFVTATGTNTYYFDRFIEGIDTSKEYFFEIESGDEKNMSEYRSMNVYFTQTKYNDTIVGKYQDQNIRLLKQKIIFEKALF